MSTQLEDAHREHLLSEGFTNDEIEELRRYGLKSVSAADCLEHGIKKWMGSRYVTDGGIWMPFHREYQQVRLNTPLNVDGKKLRYLGPSKPVKAWFPSHKYEAITEGWKDAAKPTVLGVPTAAIVGVHNIIYSIPQGCKKPIIFDSDGWRNPQVIHGLITGAIWTGGKINLFPEMPDYPKGGACEFFKSGHTIFEYKALIEEALSPQEFLEVWVSKWKDYDPEDVAVCCEMAVKLTTIVKDPNAALEQLQLKVLKKQRSVSNSNEQNEQ